MLEIIEQRFKDQKEAWESAIIKGKIFECNTANRIGDEIQLSALYKYLKTKKININ